MRLANGLWRIKLSAVFAYWSAPMSHRFPLILLLIALPLWLAASYGARYGFMEDGQWVGICADEASRWECQLPGSGG